jgi:hypothetical protein
MIFNVENTRKKKIKVVDAFGIEVKGVHKYNTRTREASIYVYGNKADGTSYVLRSMLKKNKYGWKAEIIKVKVKLKGSKIIVNDKTY